MGRIRARLGTDILFFDFRYRGIRCREYTTLTDSRPNRRKMAWVLERILAEITLGTFEYRRYFPNSPLADRFETMDRNRPLHGHIPTFGLFAEQWFQEKEVEWKRSYRATIRSTLDRYLIPHFRDTVVNRITKADVLRLRAVLAKAPGQNRRTLSADRINHIMTPLRQIVDEAASRFRFTSPWQGIKPLRVPRTEVDPFTLTEMTTFLDHVRPDFQNYYTVRFLTGLRTGEIDGLKWRYVDFDKRLIVVQETIVDGEQEIPKVHASYREVQMCEPVRAALQRQTEQTAKISEYVFCIGAGAPLAHRNVTKRIWYPTLERLGLKKRRPYQTRHTAATLWLAAGENPEWIARQLGHSNTRMLFERYSRFVPNLTRRDGSAFERLVSPYLGTTAPERTNGGVR